MFSECKHLFEFFQKIFSARFGSSIFVESLSIFVESLSIKYCKITEMLYNVYIWLKFQFTLKGKPKMKKIIAAALSILVGAFGYTIVDKALENRVATLESEVAELRGYHTAVSDLSAENGSSNEETSFEIKVGNHLYESPNSIYKFLVRQYSDGSFKYIPYDLYESVLLGETTNSQKAIARSPESPSVEMSDWADWTETTATSVYTSAYPITEFYVNLTESSAYISGIQETLSCYYDRDYSQLTKTKETYYVTIYYKGYTDSDLAGRELEIFSRIGSESYYSQTPYTTIKPDGSFELEYTIYVDAFLDSYEHCVSSINIQ
ncbi:MAG: hypothetical protein ACI4IX_07185 [Acutalibacteraceae bacterium]